jgi:internalin A
MSNNYYDHNLSRIQSLYGYDDKDDPPILDLENISLDCPIPEEVANLTCVDRVFLYAAAPSTSGEKIAFDLSPLAGMKNLRCLQINNGNMDDLSGIEIFTDLEQLNYFLECDVHNLGPLQHLTSLKSLSIRSRHISDITPLRDLTALEYLKVRGEDIADLSPLTGMTALKSLDLAGVTAPDLTALAPLTALERLSIQCDQVTDLSPLAGLHRLKSLKLLAADQSDVAPLASLTRLDKIQLQFKAVNVPALEGLNLRKALGPGYEKLFGDKT